MKGFPSSVYRLQMGEHCTFQRVEGLLPYFEALGIEGLYCSPLFESDGSHGYNVVFPNRFDPKIGTAAEFASLCTALHARGMCLIVDVVPNHMSIKGTKNVWWMDVLKHGPRSSYADFFDIDWRPQRQELYDKVLLPVLEHTYGTSLLRKEIRLVKEKEFWIAYHDYRFPLSPESSVASVSEEEEALHALLEQQHYRLAHWQVAGQEINYRRFFNINELVALCIERERVLQAHHELLFTLVREGCVQGVRIDHPDGLYDPVRYFERLQEKGISFIVVEKILDREESLPSTWQVSGTVGYEFLNLLSGLFVQRGHERQFTQAYEHFIGEEVDFSELLYARKRAFIQGNMAGEINALGWQLQQLAESNRIYRDFTRVDLTHALREILACFPIYRTYIRPDQEVSRHDREAIVQAVARARLKTPEIDGSLYDYVRDLLLREVQREEPAMHFVLRLQQQMAPVMAKGLEDSTFYLYNRFIGLNEVGGDPTLFGTSPAEFHRFNGEKLAHWPGGFLASSTHDTKWSEDARLRLAVLSEMPKQWRRLVTLWEEENRPHKRRIEGELFPDLNTEYGLYQRLLALWPDEGATPAFCERFWPLFLKALREGGVYTSWRTPHAAREEAARAFLKALLTPQATGFYASFGAFCQEVAELGRSNALSALLLKVGSCGIVDLYQGCEEWNFAHMDPDNRREVAFERSDSLKRRWTEVALGFRRAHKELFLEGDYLPLKVRGERRENVVAFARRRAGEVAIVAVGRFFSQLKEGSWEGTELLLDRGVEAAYFNNILTGERVGVHKRQGRRFLSAGELFGRGVFALLVQDKNLEI